VSRRIAYIVSQFPEFHETFILREIVDLRRRGHEITIFSLKDCDDSLVHPEAEPLMKETVYSPFFLSPRVWWAQWYWLLRRPGRYLSELARLCAGVVRAPIATMKSLVLFPKLMHYAQLISERGIPNVHAHWATIPATAGRVVARMTGARWGFTAHAWDIFVRNPLLSEKLIAADWVFTCTDFNRRHLVELVPQAAARIHLVYHGVRIPEEQTAQAAEPGQRPLLFCVGRLVETKGYPYLIDACAKVHGRGIPFRCVAVGEGPLRERLQRLIEDRELSDVIELRGKLAHAEVQALYRRARAFVLPSIVATNGDRDGIPNVILEAMAAGLAVVSTRVSGIPEAVVDGETGRLVTPRRADELADALQEILEDGERAATMGLAARSRAKQLFGEEMHMQRLDRLVERYMSSG